MAVKRSASEPESVEAFLALDQPFKEEILALREIILGADPGIAEGIKWKVPSFRTSGRASDYFATLHLRGKDGAQVILHFGAKKRDNPTAGAGIADPESLLKWLADDRAMTKFRGLEDIRARRSAFTEVIREWIQHLGETGREVDRAGGGA
jgi:hypothetical protein